MNQLTESNVPLSEEAAVIAKEASALMLRKSQDYNQGMLDQETYYLFGIKSIATMIWQKASRMVNIITSDKKENFESLEDTLIDLANYAFIGAAYLRRKQRNNDN